MMDVINLLPDGLDHLSGHSFGYWPDTFRAGFSR
jgi:hypothetical protein